MLICWTVAITTKDYLIRSRNGSKRCTSGRKVQSERYIHQVVYRWSNDKSDREELSSDAVETSGSWSELRKYSHGARVFRVITSLGEVLTSFFARSVQPGSRVLHQGYPWLLSNRNVSFQLSWLSRSVVPFNAETKDYEAIAPASVSFRSDPALLPRVPRTRIPRTPSITLYP